MMKLVLITTLLMLAGPAFAGIAKSLDGKTASCVERSDVGNTGYLPTSYSVVRSGEGLELSINLQSLVCVGGAKIDWNNSRRKFTDDVDSRTRDGQGMRLTYSRQDAALIDRNYRLLGTVDVQSATSQNFQYAISFADILSEIAWERLERGQKVEVITEFFLRAIVTAEVNGRTMPLGLRTGGSYIASFTLQKDATGEIQVVSYQLK